MKALRHIRKKNAIILASLLLATFAVVSGTAAYLFMQTEPVMNTFVSGVDPYGSITISKSVEHPYGEDYVIPENVDFKYEVDLGDEYANKTYSGYTSDEHGVIELDIPYGKGVRSVTLDEIPAGPDITVSEVDNPAGFTVEGEAERTFTVQKARDTEVAYVNVYDPEAADVNVTAKGKKTIEGRKWKDSDEFKFILERYDGKNWVKVSEDTATKEDKTFDFTQALQSMSFEDIGTYPFRVSEDKGYIGGVTYDTTVSYFDVVVSDDEMDGKLDITSVTTTSSKVTVKKDETTGAYSIDFEFNNNYAPSGSADIEIDITKEMIDKSGQTKQPSGFTFGLYDGDELIAESEATTAAGLTSIKCVYGPEDVGDHRYTLKEIDDEAPGVEYDDTKYDIQVSVVDNGDGTISAYVYDYADRVIAPTSDDAGNDIPSGDGNTDDGNADGNTDDGQNGDDQTQGEPEPADEPETVSPVPEEATDKYEASFKNTYDPEDAKLTINGDKDLDGRDIRKGEFSFDLYSTDGTYSIEGLSPKASAKNTDTAGTFNFDLSFDKIGTYYYTVVENDKGALPGVTYDKSKFFIAVTVTDEGGELKAVAAVADEAGSEADIVFRNNYVPGPCEAEIKGTKVLEGKTLQTGQFRFMLYSADKNFNAGDCLGEVRNAGNGSFSFGKITFNKAGNYYYIVKESSEDPVKNVTYDTTEYRVTVTVKDGGEGHLKASQSITAVRSGSRRSSDNIVFTNVFSAPYATIDLKATKILSGGTLKSGMFKFQLYKADAGFNKSGAPAETAANTSKGNITFSDVKFDKAGTYYFVMNEVVSEAKKGIKYDKSEFGITVDVSEDSSGQLVASVKSIKKIGGDEVKAITFTNKATGGAASGGKSPKTGDKSMLLTWVLIMLLSIEGIVVTGLLRKRQLRTDSEDEDL